MIYAILATALAACILIIAHQDKLIRHQQEKLAEALDWIDPVAVKAADTNTARDFWD